MSKDLETVPVENTVPVEKTVSKTTKKQSMVVSEVITEKRTNARAKDDKKAAVSVMYIGPNIVNVVQKSTVFKNGVYSNALNDCIEKHPYVKKLLIPIPSLAAAMKELATEKSALSVIYNKVKKLNS